MSEAASPQEVIFEVTSPCGICIEICLGDITEAKSDAIVVPEGTSFQHLGFVARRLIEVDPKYAKIREKLKQKNNSFKAWDVYTEKFGKRFRYVICGIVPPCSDDVDKWKDKLTLLYQRIFREADRKIVSVLAVPLLGSGGGGGNPDDAIKVAMVSITKFKGSSIKRVMFVSNDPEICMRMTETCGWVLEESHQSGKGARNLTDTPLSFSSKQKSSVKVSSSSSRQGLKDKTRSKPSQPQPKKTLCGTPNDSYRKLEDRHCSHAAGRNQSQYTNQLAGTLLANSEVSLGDDLRVDGNAYQKRNYEGRGLKKRSSHTSEKEPSAFIPEIQGPIIYDRQNVEQKENPMEASELPISEGNRNKKESKGGRESSEFVRRQLQLSPGEPIYNFQGILADQGFQRRSKYKTPHEIKPCSEMIPDSHKEEKQ